jgi:hypothetical protein
MLTLTVLRRLTWVGNGLALVAAGAAGWVALRDRPAPRPAETWTKAFPYKTAVANQAERNTPTALSEYSNAAAWPQGNPPPPPKVDDGPKLPPPDPFTVEHKLRCVMFMAPDDMDSYAVLQKGTGRLFAVRIGEMVPVDPYSADSAGTDWQLIALGSGANPDARPRQNEARFQNVKSQETVTLTVESNSIPGSTPGGPTASPGKGGINSVPPNAGAKLLRGARPLRLDAEKGEFEYEILGEEFSLLGMDADAEMRQLSTVPSPQGGFQVKVVPSRMQELGFQQEDRVISVNGAPVSTPTQALDVGKKQYDTGTNTFIVKVERSGKIRNYTFRAPKRRAGS